ncbi:MAG: carboxypeptidase-like regulatory domain-containing protein [Acidobacteriia bacterium]|nr:carboxypeptidase-like regulatory domain-containing protein [Terriglobia bacterium]
MKYGFEMRSDSCFARKKNRFAMHDDSCFARKMMRCGAPRNFRKLAAMAILLASVLTCAGLARAETLSGTVTNGTTGKPAAGDDVVLLMLAQGMQEAGRAKTDAQGKFSFNITDSGGPHLVRVNHQGVNYFPAGGPIRPGATTTEVKVYDSAKKLEGVGENVRVMRVQADQNSLQVIELISVKNDSSPPRALMSDRTYEIMLPQGAQVDEGVAQGPGGMPVNSAPVPDDKVKGKFYFVFPIRPGETRFQVAYHLPYAGEATLRPKVAGKLEHFAVMLPKSMEFGAKAQGVYSTVNDENGQSNLQVATQVTPEKDLTFRVTGTGMLADQQQAQGGQPEADAGGAMGGGAAAGRPGGGLGTPEGTPDPIHKYRWAILAGCLALLAAGGGWVATRNQPAPSPQPAAAAAPKVAAPKVVAPQTAVPQVAAQPVPRSAMLLEGLKEEMFQLEVERQQGSISDAEYQNAKSALDQTLQRALARAKGTSTTI